MIEAKKEVDGLRRYLVETGLKHVLHELGTAPSSRLLLDCVEGASHDIFTCYTLCCGM